MKIKTIKREIYIFLSWLVYEWRRLKPKLKKFWAVIVVGVILTTFTLIEGFFVPYVYTELREQTKILKKVEKDIEEIKDTFKSKTLDMVSKIDEGIASWYDYSLQDYPNYSKDHLTCASRDYEKGTYLIVERIDTGKKIRCRVNDYIEHPDRIIDLSSYAFSQLAHLSKGLINVRIYELKN